MILWLHVIGGAGWVGACLIFVLAATAVGEQQEELRDFLERVTPRTNRIGTVCAVLIPVTGFINLIYAASKHGYRLSTEFDAIVATKFLLLLVMSLMLMRAANLRRSQLSTARNEAGRLMLAYGTIAGCGAAALLLGLWLSGL